MVRGNLYLFKKISRPLSRRGDFNPPKRCVGQIFGTINELFRNIHQLKGQSNFIFVCFSHG
jgi:hypothetical protein